MGRDGVSDFSLGIVSGRDGVSDFGLGIDFVAGGGSRSGIGSSGGDGASLGIVTNRGKNETRKASKDVTKIHPKIVRLFLNLLWLRTAFICLRLVE